MIQFPETARLEWEVVAYAAEATQRLRKKIRHDTEVDKKLFDLRVRHEATTLFQQELDADLTPALEMGTLAEYLNNPTAAPKEMIEGVMKEDGLLVMVGPSGAGKTTLALQVVHSLMSGTDWLGQKVTQIQGGAGVLSYDMDASMIYDWLSGVPNVDTGRISVVNAHGRGNPLGVPTLRSQIAAAWKALDVEVVVLDSFSASFFGTDQNDATAVMSHYRDMKQFALTEVGAKALIVITHSTKEKPTKPRGSTVHIDTADTMVVVSKNDKGQHCVSMEKYRGAHGQIEMNPVIITAPDTVTHLVAVDVGAMSMLGMKPPGGAPLFEEVHDEHEAPEPDTETEYEEVPS